MIDCSDNRSAAPRRRSGFARIIGSVGLVAVFAGVSFFVNSFQDEELDDYIHIPPCQEGDRANDKVIDMPTGVPNDRIANSVCFVRVSVDGGGDRIELRFK